jgi:hypothetical protein
MPLDSCIFSVLNFFEILINLFPLQDFIAIDLANKNFYLLHAFSSHGNGSNKF